MTTTLTNSIVGLAEAKNRLSELIARVARGDEITITRHGEAIARLVPAKCPSREEARKAIAAIRALRVKHRASLSVKEIIALKNEGRP